MLRVLTRRLEASASRLDRLDRYYAGRAGLAYATERFRQAFDGRLAHLGANYSQLVVQAVAERLQVVGFRLAGQEDADQDAWRIWQANDLDEGSQLAHVDALALGRAYVLVWAAPDGSARITVESARQVYVEHHPGSRQRTAAVKQWAEGDDAFATLYLPDAIHRFSARTTPGSAPTVWTRRGEPVPNPLGVVPVVPLVNRARLLDFDGASELDPIIPLQDLLNRFLADLVVAAEYLSLPRRWATGLEIETDPETGQPREPFDPVGRLWQAESEAARFGAFPEADLSGLLAAIEQTVQHIGSVSAVPPHYLLSPAAKGGPSSAESIKSSEASLVAKVKRRMLSFGSAWEEVLRLALAVERGAVPSGAEAAETVWADPETRSLAQAADAALKRKEVGVPVLQLWRDLGYSEVEIVRMREFVRQEAADRSADVDALLRGL
jgi:hypothetical protein